MNEKYVPAEVEAAAQSHWSARNAYRVTEDANRPKFYACSMLPYPSGKLHMGHVRNYTINDMMARYLRMKGFNVLMPMGWDAFGLPAENAAMDNNVPPAQWTRANIADMKSQMQPLGLAFDWTREVATCDPSYYKWNQWFFLKMLDKGIAYKKTQIVNWDPVDQTVLANEQVVDGRGWRSGAIVEKREIPGYYLAITQYAEELLAGVTDTTHRDYLEGWPERVRLMQEHWIGKSEGVRFAFTHDIRDASGALIQDGRMYVFTTRADTIKGVTFCAVAPEHPLATHAAPATPRWPPSSRPASKVGTTEAELALKDKEGMPTGLLVKHPLTDEMIPVWVGNYVLITYGDGAVMGVPAHDERDFAFALKYQLPIKQVVHVDGQHFDYHRWHDWYADKSQGITINSGNYSGLPYKRRRGRHRRGAAGQGPGREEDHLAPARLGHQPPALLGHADPDHPLRRNGGRGLRPRVRQRAGAREGPARAAAGRPGARRQRQPAEQVRRLPERRLPAVRQAGAARDRHDGHLRRFGLVLHALHLPRQRRGDGRRPQRLLDADGPVHRRHRARRAAPAVRTFLDQGHARHRPGHLRRAVHEAVHAGHAAQRVLLPRGRQPARSAGSTPAKSTSASTTRATRWAPPPRPTASR
jgi:hypothetical protein